MKSFRIEALVLGLAAIFGCWIIKAGIDNYTSQNRTVSAKGLSEIEVKADQVTWPLQFYVMGNDLEVIYDNIEKAQETIITFLHENNIKDNEISVAPPAIQDTRANAYSYNENVPRYKANCVVTVFSKNVDAVRQTVMQQVKLLKQGVAIITEEYSSKNLEYSFTGLNKVKPQLIEEATRNARETARKFAEDTGSELGELQTAYQGQIDISDRDVNTPWIKNLRIVTTLVYYLK